MFVLLGCMRGLGCIVSCGLLFSCLVIFGCSVLVVLCSLYCCLLVRCVCWVVCCIMLCYMMLHSAVMRCFDMVDPGLCGVDLSVLAYCDLVIVFVFCRWC